MSILGAARQDGTLVSTGGVVSGGGVVSTVAELQKNGAGGLCRSPTPSWFPHAPQIDYALLRIVLAIAVLVGISGLLFWAWQEGQVERAREETRELSIKEPPRRFKDKNHGC